MSTSDLALSVTGTFNAVPVRDFYTDEILRHAETDMSGAEMVAADEVLDITQKGTCLIEAGDGQRYVVTISEGRMQGPLRVMQIEDISVEDLRREEIGRRLFLILSGANIAFAFLFSMIALNLARMTLITDGIPAYAPAILFPVALLAFAYGIWMATSFVGVDHKAKVRSILAGLPLPSVAPVVENLKLALPKIAMALAQVRKQTGGMRMRALDLLETVQMRLSRIRDAITSVISRRTAL